MFQVAEIPDKGRGVITEVPLERGTFVCSYHGEHIDTDEGHRREEQFELEDADHGDYIFYIDDLKAIDATAEDNSLGRLLNHSRKRPNCEAKKFRYQRKTYIVLKTKKDIQAGNELTFDYGETRPYILEVKKWLTET